MINQNTPTQTDSNIVQSYLGIDISAFNCIKLEPNPIYQKYQHKHLHYPIGAIQKGLKPHTQRGIKRIQKRNKIKKDKLKNQFANAAINRLNPKSPEQIVIKAMRTAFRTQIEKNNQNYQNQVREKSRAAVRRLRNLQMSTKKQDQCKSIIRQIELLNKQIKDQKSTFSSRRRRSHSKKQYIQNRIKSLQLNINEHIQQLQIKYPQEKVKLQNRIKRKENQRKRRIQLIKLVKQNSSKLRSHFGDRISGFGMSRCPKISRKQIKNFLQQTKDSNKKVQIMSNAQKNEMQIQ